MMFASLFGYLKRNLNSFLRKKLQEKFHLLNLLFVHMIRHRNTPKEHEVQMQQRIALHKYGSYLPFFHLQNQQLTSQQI